MTNAIGVDIQYVDEVALSLKEFGSRYTRRIFTSKEIEHCRRNPVTESRSYAERFAAKEAVLKLMDVREVIPSWKDIEVRQDTEGRTALLLHRVAAVLAHERGIQDISLEISHARGVVIAVAVTRHSG